MYRDQSVAVVIPAHNEERHVGEVIENIPSFVDSVIVVDDASRDGTADVVIASNRSNVRLIRRAGNGGMGSAIVDGFRGALGQGADLVAVLDADGQMDSGQLPRLLDPIVDGETDFAKGNRFFSRRSFEGMPAHRVFGNLVLTFLTKAATGYWHMFDSENGYTAISAQILRRLPLEKLETGYQFANRLLIHLSAADARVVDVPIPARYGEESSGIRVVRDGALILGELFVGFWRRCRAAYLSRPSIPGTALVSGMTLLAAAMALGLWSWIEVGRWRPALAVAAGSLGAILVGAFLALDARANRRRRDRSMEQVEARAPTEA
jgi:glycosyltransferase involved in cell wall biosynthesis